MNNKNFLKIKYNLLAILSIILLIALDQFTKILAVKSLMNKDSYILIPGIFEFHYLENRGAAFGILQNQKFFFILIGLIIVAAIFFIYQKMPFARKYIPLRLVSIFMISGALGNMVDRVKYNYVVDFFYFKLIDFPIFNVADCYVTVSAVFLIFLFLFYYKEDDLVFLNFKKKESTGESNED